MEITFNNFFVSSKASFKSCKEPRREPDYISYGRYGQISSCYWYGEDKKGKYVIRWSEHWSHIITHEEPMSRYGRRDEYWLFENESELTECIRVASCFWILYGKTVSGGCGKCYLQSFKPN